MLFQRFDRLLFLKTGGQTVYFGEIGKNADTLIMETHARFIGEEKYSLMMSKLADLGFKTLEETGFVIVLRR